MTDINTAISLAVHTGSGFLRAPCPFCWLEEGARPRKRNLAINPTTGWYRCWKCSQHGNIGAGHDISYDIKKSEQVDEFEPPEGFTRFSDLSNFGEHLAAYLYLTRTRSVPEIALDRCEIGVCSHGHFAGCVIVPILDAGRWRGYVARRVAKPEYRYPKGMKRGELFFNGDALWKFNSSPVLLVEGVFDALPYWPHAVAVLGKPSNKHKEILLTVQRPIAVCLDADAQGEGWALAQYLAINGVNAKFLPLPPGFDPAEVDAGWLMAEARNLFRSATK